MKFLYHHRARPETHNWGNPGDVGNMPRFGRHWVFQKRVDSINVTAPPRTTKTANPNPECQR